MPRILDLVALVPRDLSVGQVLLGSITTLIFLLAARLTYNAYFHPLARYPGPKWWGASFIPSTLSAIRGTIPFDVTALHERYGPVVRLGPNELAFTTAQAWTDIYGLHSSSWGTQGQMPKYGGSDSYEEGFGRLNMTNATVEDHTRMRRMVGHAFSDRAMRDVEPIVQQYVGLLVERLGEMCDRGEDVDAVAWMNFTTFDLMGDLAFSDDFECLKKGVYNPWISMIFNNVKLMVYSNAAKQIPGLTKVLMSITPKKVLEEGKAHMRLAVDQANKRLDMKTDRQDIMSYIIDSNYSKGGNGMTVEEIQANSYVLIIAGSETTATLLSGCLFLLLTHRDIYDKLIKEIRSSFTSESEITSAACANLKYLLAVLNEALRIYPPVPGALPRQVPRHGATVDAHPVPAGTAVSVYTWAANYSASNFADAHKFAPERWLGDAADEEDREKYANDVREACQPFSYGPRNCAGKNLAYMEMRLVLARLLWNFDVDFAESEKGKNWLAQRVFLLWEKPPMMVKLTRRKF